MRVTLKGFPLTPQGAQHLRQILSGERSNPSASALIDHVLDLGAVYAVAEEPYIDQDYSSDYLNFYAAAFRDHGRSTTRIHFFAEDVSPILARPVVEQPDALAATPYLGFVVVRPIAQGPIGRTILKYPTLKNGLTVRPAARADFKAHLLGAELKIAGAAPFIQQDTRLGSCAQAAIWMASRPLHERHRRTTWHSIAEITRMATTPTDMELSRSLPAGSGGLNPIHIIRALRAMGHQPLFDLFLTEADENCPTGRSTVIESSGQSVLSSEPPAAQSILRYLDSGLPVIIAWADAGQKVGHAITAVGFVETQGQPCRSGSTYDVFARALVVHDDQRGPYRLMPLTDDDIAFLPTERLHTFGDKVLTVEKSATHMFVPLPQRVLLRADRADTVADDFLKQYVTLASAGVIDRAKETCVDSVAGLEAFNQLVLNDGVVRRTYLTSAGRYRHHLSRGDLANEVKAELLVRTLPHFVWVTELLETGSAQEGLDGPRKILGHMVVNATSSTDPDSDLLVAHLPHVLIHRDVNPPPDAIGEFVETAALLEGHAPYLGRRRH